MHVLSGIMLQFIKYSTHFCHGHLLLAETHEADQRPIFSGLHALLLLTVLRAKWSVLMLEKFARLCIIAANPRSIVHQCKKFHFRGMLELESYIIITCTKSADISIIVSHVHNPPRCTMSASHVPKTIQGQIQHRHKRIRQVNTPLLAWIYKSMGIN